MYTDNLSIAQASRMRRRRFAVELFILFVTLAASTPLFASGKLDDARAKYYGPAQSSFVAMVENLDKKNFEAALKSAEALKEQLTKVADDFLYIEEAVKALDPEPQRAWSEFYGTGSAWRYLSLYTGKILQEIGKRDHTESMNQIKENYVKCGEHLNRVTTVFKEYGRRVNEKYKKLEVVSDSWK